MKTHTIHDVIADGVPYGDVTMGLKVDHHNFFRCKIFDRRTTNLAEIALFEQIDPRSIFDQNGNLTEEAKSTNLFQIAIKAVEEAFDDGRHPLVPDDIVKTPELVEGVAIVLMRAGIEQASYYSKTCSEIIERQNGSTHQITDRSIKISSGNELCQHFGDSLPIDEEEATKISRKYYDHDLVGGNSYGHGLSAFHLAMTILDPHHETPLMHQHGFQIFYKEVNPERKKSSFQDVQNPVAISAIKAIPQAF